MKVLITGSNGFIGKNLRLHLAERDDLEVVCYTRANEVAELPDIVRGVDFVFHLAGVNRPKDEADFAYGNVNLTHALCGAVSEVFQTTGRKIPVVYASSIQALRDNPYGSSKLAAEEVLQKLMCQLGVPVYIFRLPNVFGKWCKPNYNSVVATFCYNVARDLPIFVNDPSTELTLVHVDDVIACFMRLLAGESLSLDQNRFTIVQPEYKTTVGELVQKIRFFKDSRVNLMTERVGSGLLRALYSTYVSYLPPELFSYQVPQYGDSRGVFVEMLKTPDCGQFSYFTAGPGVTRGGHYHHSKTEKFLVIKGEACFKFRHMQTGEKHELRAVAAHPQIVETVPGWTHDITNIGTEDMIVMLWANEVFDRTQPDTFACPLGGQA